MSRPKRYCPHSFHIFKNSIIFKISQVDAQVIVDMTSAINKNAQWHEASEDLDFDKSRLTAADKRETQLPPFCMHGKYSEGC